MPATTTVTEQVEAAFAGTPDERLRTVMQALVRHLHAFASEVELTEAEWMAGIEFLTATGHKSDERRQEFILLSDVLGLSMLTVQLNHGDDSQATEPTVFGPFFMEGSPRIEEGGDLARGASGEPCLVRGRVVGTDGTPIAGAHVEVWQADDTGHYDVQYDDLDHAQGRGHLVAGDDGRFSFWTVKPVAYPIPDDGPVGALMAAAHRSVMRPAHVHFMVSAPGRATLITHVFDREDPHLATDAVFGVKPSLVADFRREGDHHTLDYEFVLGEQQ